MKKISIIIPIYNAEKYLEECLDSIKQQSYKNYEVIMINDGSTDRSESICRKFLEDDRFQIVNQKNKGVAISRNVGLTMAKGEYILFVDSDDWLDNNMLNELINNAGDDELLCVGYYNAYENHKLQVTNGKNIVIKQDLKKSIMNDNNIIGGYLWNKLFDLNIIKQNNIKFDKDINYCEDLIFVLNYIRFINRIRYISKPLYFYRMRKTSITKQGCLNEKNITILKALEILMKMNKDDEETVKKLEFEYLLYYYQLKKIMKSNEVVNYEILKKEKKIIKMQSTKKKLELFLIKYTYKCYFLLKKIKNHRNVMYE